MHIEYMVIKIFFGISVKVHYSLKVKPKIVVRYAYAAIGNQLYHLDTFTNPLFIYMTLYNHLCMRFNPTYF